MRTSHLLGLALLCGASAVAATATCSGDEAREATATATQARDVPDGPTRGAPTLAASADGVARTYDVEISVDAEANIAALLGRPSGDGEWLRRRLAIRGQLEELELGTLDDRVVSWIHADAATVEGDDGASEALRRGIVVARGANGEIEAVRIPVGASAPDRGLLQHVAELWQAAPPAPDTATWTIEEASVLGTVAADYTRDADGAIAKRIEHVVERAPNAAAAPIDAAIDASGELTFDGNALRSLAATYATTLTAAGATEPGSRTTTRAQLTLSGRHADATRARAIAAHLDETHGPWRRLDDPPPRAELEAAQRRALGDASLEEVLAAIRAGDTAASGRLRAYLALHPDAAAVLAARLHDLAPNTDEARELLGTLATAESEPAQRALVDVVETWRDAHPETAGPLVAYLGGLGSPDETTEAYLRSLRDHENLEVAFTADLALGHVARTLGGSDRAAAIVDELITALATAPRGRVGSIVDALGNTGDQRALDAIAPYLADDDWMIRRSAISAVGRIPGPRADALLGQAIASEADDGLLGLAVAVAADRAPSHPVADAIRLRLGEPHAEALLQAMQAELARADSAL